MSKNIESVLGLLKASEEKGYIGEEITQLEHALQSAFLAKQAGADDEVVLAALLHDVGHYCDSQAPQMEDLGTLRHERLGAQYLLSLGFSPRVASLVEGHVNAKRYLVSTGEAYKKKLSPASLCTLEFQGGMMSSLEIQDFENNNDFLNLLRLRAWDDQAKVKGLEVPGLDSYGSLMAEHLRAAEEGQTQGES